jgi:hypothetical protein
MSLFGIKMRFIPTPKERSEKLNPLWLIPQIVSVSLLSGGILYNVLTVSDTGYNLNYIFAPLLIFIHSGIFIGFLESWNLTQKIKFIFIPQLIKRKSISRT